MSPYQSIKDDVFSKLKTHLPEIQENLALKPSVYSVLCHGERIRRKAMLMFCMHFVRVVCRYGSFLHSNGIWRSYSDDQWI